MLVDIQECSLFLNIEELPVLLLEPLEEQLKYPILDNFFPVMKWVYDCVMTGAIGVEFYCRNF